MNDDYQVKIWYTSGAYEEVSHISPQDAATIYTEALGNRRVCRAEVHDSNRFLVRSLAGLTPTDNVG